MATADLIRELHAVDDGPWTDLQGKPLDSRRLAKELDRYSVRPKDLKLNGKALKGYRVDGDGGLADAWSRYLPPVESSATAATSATAQASESNDTEQVARPGATSATGNAGEVAESRGSSEPTEPPLTSAVAEVAVVADETSEQAGNRDRAAPATPSLRSSDQGEGQ